MQQNSFGRIDTHDFIWFVLQKWKIILICILVFIALFAGVFEIQETKKAKVSSDEEIVAIKSRLNNEEISNVESSAKNILNYRKMYDLQKKYINSSIFQNIDPYNICSVSLEYYVDNNYEVIYPIVEKNNDIVPIVQAYVSLLQTDDLLEKMVNDIDSSQTISNFSELIEVDFDQQAFGAFIIKIYADDFSVADQMAEIVEKYLNDNVSSICDSYSQHDLILVSKSEKTIIDTSVAEQQQLNLRNLYDINESINKEETLYKDESLMYLQALIHEQIVSEDSIVKYIVLGGVAGIFVSVMAFVLAYLVSGKIRSADEIAINVCEGFSNEIYYDFGHRIAIDRFIAKKRNRDSCGDTYDSKIDLLASEINCLLKKCDYKKIGFVFDTKRESTCKCIDDLNRKILDEYEKCTVGNVLKDPISLSNLAIQDVVVIIVTRDESRYTDLFSQIAKCHEFGTKILGIVITD